METLTMNKIDYKKYWDKGIDYHQYLKNFAAEMEPGVEVQYGEYLPQNWSRQTRLYKKAKFEQQLLEKVSKENQKKWLVISEHWCGDASQIVPLFQKFADLSKGNIELRFVYRDENPELIDAHLTDGRSRSIPIVLSLNEEFNVEKVYGPRPAEAQTLTQKLISSGESYNIPLHTWYAKDKQVSLKKDLGNFLS